MLIPQKEGLDLALEIIIGSFKIESTVCGHLSLQSHSQ